MKNNRRLIGISLIVYCILAIFMYLAMQESSDNMQNAYKVEINRLYYQMKDPTLIPQDIVKDCTYVNAVTYLSADRRDAEDLQNFYQNAQQDGYAIKPWYEKGKLKGYLRFTYQLAHPQYQKVLWHSEILLFITELCVIALLLYLQQHLLQPLKILSALPMEFAKGHYKAEIHHAKQQDLSAFLWGLGQLKDQLEISKKRQLELEKEKKQMLLSMSHDVKTPLHLIHLYAKAIEEEIYTERKQLLQAAIHINKKADEIEQYVESIMKTSREDILDIQVVQGEFYLQELMERSVKLFQEACAIRQITFCMEPYENRLLKGDINRLQEVLENIFDNALKYGDGNQIKISFHEEEHCQLITFFNSGEVVHEQDFNHMFDSFYRGANQQGKAGCGLGLYICRAIMHKMGGEIYAETKQDGMAFTLVIPY